MNVGPVSRHYDVYVTMCRVETMRIEEQWTLISRHTSLQLQQQHGHIQELYSLQMQHRPQQQHQYLQQQRQEQQPRQRQHLSDQTEQKGRIDLPQNTNDHQQIRLDLSPAHASRASLSLHTHCTTLAQRGAYNRYSLMTAIRRKSGSQTVVYSKNIVVQRTLSGKPPLQAGNYPEVKDEKLQKESRERYSGRSKISKQSLNAPKVIKPENHWSSKLSRPLKPLFTFVKRISESSCKINVTSRDSKPKLAIACGNSLSPKQSQSASGKKNNRHSSPSKKNTQRLTSEEKPLPSCGRRCIREDRAFQCCTCGRTIVLKRRIQKRVNCSRDEEVLRHHQAEQTSSGRNSSPTGYSSRQDNSPFVTWNFAMTSYQVFSFTCLLLAIPSLYTAFTYGVFDDVMDFKRSGPLKEFYNFVGLCVVVRLAWTLVVALWNRYGASVDETFFEHELWAVITGCTNGIGKEFARQLAAKKLNLILISRDPGLLMELARDITNEFHVRTVTVQADFSSDKKSLYDMLDSRLQGFDIVVLVNNVGTSHDTIDRFHVNTPDSLVSRMIHVNMMSMAKMTQMLLPGMLARRCGVIINVSSAFGRNPTPYLALYSATKSFADFFSRALLKEYGKYHIAVQSLTPYTVSTNMVKNAPPTTLLPPADTYVRSALSTVGRASRTHGYLPHSILGAVLDRSPSCVRLLYIKLFQYRASKFMARLQLQQRD